MAIEAPTFSKPSTPDIYPIGSDAIIQVVRPIYSNPGQELDLPKKLELLESENPYANQLLVSLAQEAPEREANYYVLGVVFAYEVFKERAGGKKLPILTYEFVHDYFESREERLDMVYGSKAEEEGTREIDVVRGLFAILEKDAYKTLEEEAMGKGYSLFDSQIFLGFLNSYFLFREGFSDSDYWE